MKPWQMAVLVGFLLVITVAAVWDAVDAWEDNESSAVLMLDASECDRLINESLDFDEGHPVYNLLRDLWMAHCP